MKLRYHEPEASTLPLCSSAVAAFVTILTEHEDPYLKLGYQRVTSSLQKLYMYFNQESGELEVFQTNLSFIYQQYSSPIPLNSDQPTLRFQRTHKNARDSQVVSEFLKPIKE